METNIGESAAVSLYSSYDDAEDDDDDDGDDVDGGVDDDGFPHRLTSFTPALIIPAISGCPSTSTSATYNHTDARQQTMNRYNTITF